MSNYFEKKTKRLVIRPYSSSDYDVWRDAYLSLKKPKNKWDNKLLDKNDLTKSKFKKMLQLHAIRRKKDTFYDFVAFDKNSGQLIGFSSLMDISRGIFQNAYLGYGIFNQYWGNGFGKEMVKATTEIAFKDLQIHRLEAGIEPKNKRSISLAKAIGMRREGLSKRRLYLNGKWTDLVLYAMTAEETDKKVRL